MFSSFSSENNKKAKNNKKQPLEGKTLLRKGRDVVSLSPRGAINSDMRQIYACCCIYL